MPKGLTVTRLPRGHSHRCECLLTRGQEITECGLPAVVRVDFTMVLSTTETYYCDEHYRRRIQENGEPDVKDLPIRKNSKPLPKVQYSQKKGCYVDGDGLNHLDEHGDPGA